MITSLGMKAVVGSIPLGAKRKSFNPVCMITSAPSEGQSTSILDILLPAVPWVAPAVERAQHNRLDLGFAHVPVITPEDLVVAKCLAVTHAPDRFQDLDDLKEIFSHVRNLDADHIESALHELQLEIPRVVQKHYHRRPR